ncbi:MAG: ABC transporter ATP-binding protein [Deltaproteobacteria bacterium]|nr:ABC transporter ATP-binding protein [Deltaproteobacteria bacterium]
MSMTGQAAAVRFDAVSKHYGPVVAVDRISFEVQAGDLVTLLGPSGCGKTTTLRLIAGLEMPTSGSVFIDGHDVSRLPASARDVSMVFQSYALFPHMTVFENVSYGLSVSGIGKAETRDRAEEGLRLVGLAGYGERLPSELSGGQQQRVAVARALVLEPTVLLFDEPLSNLDAKLRRRVREEIRELQQTLGLTTVYVTHDQEEALAVSDRIVVMRNAEIAQEGAPVEVYEAPRDLFVADFVGDANVVEAELVSREGDHAIVRVGNEVELRLPHRNLPAGPVKIAIRPEAVILAADEKATGLAATVLKATYLGSHVEYTLDTALGEIFVADHQFDTLISPGSRVRIAFRDRGITLLEEQA